MPILRRFAHAPQYLETVPMELAHVIPYQAWLDAKWTMQSEIVAPSQVQGVQINYSLLLTLAEHS